MRLSVTAHLILLAGSLIAAVVSMLFLTLPWYHLTAAGRTHAFYLGPLPLLPFVDSFPFSWPFAIAGFVCRRLDSSTTRSFLWTLGGAVLGVALYSCLVRVWFASSDVSTSIYLNVVFGFISPIVYALVGFLFAHLLRFIVKA